VATERLLEGQEVVWSLRLAGCRLRGVGLGGIGHAFLQRGTECGLFPEERTPGNG
jgi:hypothetical protein